jgi:hypothetical protein
MKKGYFAVVLDDASKAKLLEKSIHDNKFSHHITIDFGSDAKKLEHLVGKDYEMNVVGKIANNELDGVVVDLPEELKQVFTGKVPHVTMSCCEGVAPVNTGIHLSRDGWKKVDEGAIKGKFEFIPFKN